MAQQELNALETRLAKTIEMLHLLKSVDPLKRNDEATFGSLVQTNMGIYFISVGYGSIRVCDEQVFCISLASPIGQLFSGKGAKGHLDLNGEKIQILSIE